MKKQTQLVTLIAILLIIISCSKSDGNWDDNIQLSTKNVKFNSNSNSITITTKGDWWWVYGVSVNNINFDIPETINTESENYIFEEDCFIIEKKDKNTLYIEVDENNSNAERKIVVYLEAGDYFDSVKVLQNTK